MLRTAAKTGTWGAVPGARSRRSTICTQSWFERECESAVDTLALFYGGLFGREMQTILILSCLSNSPAVPRGDSDVCFFFCSTWFVCFQLWFGSRFGRLNVRLVDCLSWLAGRSLLACMCINWTSCDAWHRLLFCLHSSSMEEGALFSSLSLHARSGGACHILLRKGTILFFFRNAEGMDNVGQIGMCTWEASYDSMLLHAWVTSIH